jgi:hypothetical protein
MKEQMRVCIPHYDKSCCNNLGSITESSRVCVNGVLKELTMSLHIPLIQILNLFKKGVNFGPRVIQSKFFARISGVHLDPSKVKAKVGPGLAFFIFMAFHLKSGIL